MTGDMIEFKKVAMSVIILYNVAEYCDNAAKLTIKQQGKEVRTEIWSSDTDKITVETKSYSTNSIAHRKYYECIGKAVLGGWHVLNAYPKKETAHPHPAAPVHGRKRRIEPAYPGKGGPGNYR